MRRRIYWLLPDVASARRTMSELLLARVEHRHIHCMARDGVDLADLHEANVLQSSDLIGSAQIGLGVGAALGAAAGAVLAMSVGLDDASKPLVVGALAAAGALFGAWSASLIGASIPSRRLARFDAALARGEILLMADLPHRRVRDVEALVLAGHPEAHFEGQEPQVPAFP
ncbi:MAG: DUF1269 domain-containing protein [Burkholderiales bacterium]|nr:DUF1269 domain-containing protein [Burkholderiales bacterium]MDE2453667.1 DUF1269 domain-containing protein [Burkholderiales bacterium]